MNDDQNPQRAGDGYKCLACGYNISGLALGERCPECGSEVKQFASPGAQTSGKAITSMVLGIISIVTCMGYGIVGLPCGIIAVIFAKKARLAIQAGSAPASSQGMATAGKVCGWIGIVLNSLMLAYLVVIIFVLILGAAGAAATP